MTFLTYKAGQGQDGAGAALRAARPRLRSRVPPAHGSSQTPLARGASSTWMFFNSLCPYRSCFFSQTGIKDYWFSSAGLKKGLIDPVWVL